MAMLAQRFQLTVEKDFPVALVAFNMMHDLRSNYFPFLETSLTERIFLPV